LAQHFCDVDRRVLWGSYGDWNMKNVWKNYYDEQTYKKLQQIRKAADPQGIFTPNPFCVEAAGPETGLSEAGEKHEESGRQPEQAEQLTLRLSRS